MPCLSAFCAELGRTPYTAVHAKFDKRGSPEVIEALAASFCGYDGPEIEAALGRLVQLYQRQVIALHKKFPLMRPLESDLAALDVISQAGNAGFHP
jgi:hypothetical protein